MLEETSMSFVTAQPEALAYAAGKLQTLGSAMADESAAATAPTVGVTPAAADEVSALQATVFAAYGSLYQSVNAQAEAIHEFFVQTLSASAGTYAATESANASTTASPLAGVSGFVNSAAAAAAADPPGSNVANLINIGGGNWSAAASDLLNMASGGLLPATNEVGDFADEAGVASGGLDATALTGAVAPASSPGWGAVPMAAGLAQAPSPSWAASDVAASTPAPAAVDAWTASAPQRAAVTTVPAGVPLTGTPGKTAGLGAPRYGVKPAMIPRPAVG
jgi:PE family/PPE-SVP subfamily C-terminal region